MPLTSSILVILKPEIAIVKYNGCMAKLLKIAQLGHPVLRQKAKVVTSEEIQTDEFQDLIESMFATLVDADGVGLAAPQVHENKCLFIVRIQPDKPEEDKEPAEPMPEIRQVFINPEITNRSGEVATDWEGCLSFFKLRGLVPRPKSITVKALNRDGKEFEIKTSDFHARVVQHEFDHLEGVLYPDRMEDLSSLTYLENWHRQKEMIG